MGSVARRTGAERDKAIHRGGFRFIPDLLAELLIVPAVYWYIKFPIQRRGFIVICSTMWSLRSYTMNSEITRQWDLLSLCGLRHWLWYPSLTLLTLGFAVLSFASIESYINPIDSVFSHLLLVNWRLYVED